AFAAIFAAMNTMYAAVAARTTEIGTLRALGFSPLAIMTSFLAESSALAFAAGIIGVILALPVNGLSTKFNGGAVSAPTLAFNFRQGGWPVAHSANDDGSGEDGPPVQRAVDRLWLYSHPPQIHHYRHKSPGTDCGRTHRGGAAHQSW